MLLYSSHRHLANVDPNAMLFLELKSQQSVCQFYLRFVHLWRSPCKFPTQWMRIEYYSVAFLIYQMCTSIQTIQVFTSFFCCLYMRNEFHILTRGYTYIFTWTNLNFNDCWACMSSFLPSINSYDYTHCTTHGDKNKYSSNFIKQIYICTTLHWPNKLEYMIIKRMEFIIYINNNTKVMAEFRGAAHNMPSLCYAYELNVCCYHSHQRFDTNIGSIGTHTLYSFNFADWWSKPS